MFGAIVRAHRQRLCLTQEELAHRAGVGVRSVRNIEAGRISRPRPGTVRLLADALSLDGADRADFFHSAVAGATAGPEPDAPAPVPPAGAAAGQWPVRPIPAQLPADVAGFTGRADQLSELTRLLDAGDGPSAVVISTIAGTAGVGKTALAVHWGHQIAGRFPDGQLYIDLRGYASGPPQRPEEALAAMLRSLGTPPEQIPADQSQAAALLRSQLAGRRVLVVLDNAASADQVRPLLPGSPGCLVLVTSRDRMAGLVAREGAHRVSLDVLEADEAIALLTRLLGAERVDADPAATARLANACAYLPLALRIAAANLANHPHRTIAAQVAELTGGDRLTALAADSDEHTAVRAALALSYRSIPVEAQRLFRLLGLVPGQDVTAAAAAALAGMAPPAVDRLLDRLAGAHLVQEHAAGRYAFHDLLRLYARQLTEAEDPAADRNAASARLFAWYLHTAMAAADLLYPQLVRLPAVPVEFPVPPAGFAEPDGALAWLDTELPNLAAAVGHAADHRQRSFAWRLADCLRGYLFRRRQAVTWQAVATNALIAAEREHDLPGQAAARISLAHLHQVTSEYPAATEHYLKAAELARGAGWTDGEATAVSNLGMVYREQGHMSRAAESYRRALVIFERTGQLGGEATNRSKLAVVEMELGRLREAAAQHAEALARYRKLGSVDAEALTLANLGVLYNELGSPDLAYRHLLDASALQEKVGDPVLAANILDGLAQVHRDTGRLTEAQECSDAALATLADIRDRRYEPGLLATRGSLHLRAGRVRQAVEEYRQALDLARQLGFRLFEIDALIGLATGHERLGDHATADLLAGDALARAQAVGYRVAEGMALAVIGEIRAGQGEYEEAEHHVQRALGHLRETGHRLGEARALALLARLQDLTDG